MTSGSPSGTESQTIFTPCGKGKGAKVEMANGDCQECKGLRGINYEVVGQFIRSFGILLNSLVYARLCARHWEIKITGMAPALQSLTASCGRKYLQSNDDHVKQSAVYLDRV